MIVTFDTKYGTISLYNNDMFICEKFKKNEYWDENILIEIKKYINPNKNILEIGGHCGTSSMFYAKCISDNNKLYVYEPQKEMFKLLMRNIKQNNLENKIFGYNCALFCYNGIGKMNDLDLDGSGALVEKRYNEENNQGCNFGGIGLDRKSVV